MSGSSKIIWQKPYYHPLPLNLKMIIAIYKGTIYYFIAILTTLNKIIY